MISTQLISLYILSAFAIYYSKSHNHNHIIHKRFLIFPQQTPTRYQFICGIGIPADLDQESLTVGYVLKSEYFLPYNATVFRQNPFVPEFRVQRNIEPHRYKMENDFPNFMTRFNAYKAFEKIISRTGLYGNECLLHAICESAKLPFVQNFDIYADLIHIFLTPSSTLYEDDNRLNIYYGAESLGKAGESCNQAYKYCNISLLDLMSTFF